MRHHVIILQLFFLLAFNACQVLGEDSFDGAAHCAGKEAGVYPDAQSNCTQFYICEVIVDHSTHWSCLRGTRFDAKTCDCQAENGVSCDPDDAAIVTQCKLSTKDSLAAAKRASRDTQQKIPESKPEQTTPENEPELTTPDIRSGLNATSNSCSNKATGLYPNVGSSCHSYYACLKGVSYVYEYTCPKFFTFDHGKCLCLPAHLTKCEEAATPCFPSPPVTRPTTTLPPPPPPSDFCRGKGPGYYTDVNRGCEWYFVCEGGDFQTYQFQCPSHLRFNHFTCNCDYPYAVPCTIFNEVPCIPPKNRNALL